MLEKKPSEVIVIFTLIFTLISLLTPSMIQNSHANSITDMIKKQQAKQWFLGKNLNPGDSFTFRICDKKTFTKSNFAEKCYTVKLDFYDIFDGSNGKTWIVQSLIFFDGFTKPSIFQIDASTFEITTDYSNLEFSQSVENTLFNIGEFANSNSPKILQVGQSWGTIPSYLTADLDVAVYDEDVTEIDHEEFEVFEVGYNIKEQSTYSLSKQFPFPLWGQAYSSTVIYPEPDFLFSFKLLEYALAPKEITADFERSQKKENPDSSMDLTPADPVPANSDDMICVPKEFFTFYFEDLFVKGMESDIVHETFIHPTDKISEN